VLVVFDALGQRVFDTGIENVEPYSKYVDEGWGLWGPRHAKYEIRPRLPGGWLHWQDRETGEHIFARKVMHPGAPGQHMTAIAAAMTEHEVGVWADRILREWAHDFERGNRSHVVIGRV
jgi:hypothetical protein